DPPYADDASPIIESPGHIADSELMEEDSIDYLDDNEDPEEDTKEDHTDYPADGEDGDDEPSNDDDVDKDEDPTEDEQEEEHLALTDSFAVPVVDPVPSARDTETHLRRAWKTVKLEPPMSASMEARIAAHAAVPIPPTNPAYDQAPLGHRAAMIRIRDDIPEEDMPPQRRFVLTAPPPGCDVVENSVAAARPPRGQYDFVNIVEAGQGSIHSPGHDARTIARAANRRQSCMRIVPVTRQGANDAMTPESIQAMIDQTIQRNSTHTQDDASQSSGEGLRRPVQPARVCSYTDFMKYQPLNFKGTEGVVGLS
ncbi:hypothetical protein Tco_1206620, partial [Tanacetum coccineum]